MRRAIAALIVGLLAVALAGCAKPVISDDLMKRVTADLTMDQVRKDPAAAKGNLVLWGGRIVRTVLADRGTLVEVAQFPLDDDQRPDGEGSSQGRFIVAMDGYLEPLQYYAGRDVTVVGEVAAVEDLPHGGVKLTYVVLRGKEIYAWAPRPIATYVGPEVGFGVMAGPGDYWWNGPFLWW